MAESVTRAKLDFKGFRPETVDKVRHLLVVLDRINSHPYLKSRVCLHGGTALNLFFLGAPRLSVDSDLNYIGSYERDVMYAERPELEKALMNIGRELGFDVQPGAEEHSGRSFKLHYTGVGGADHVKIDMNYLNRSPLLALAMGTVETSDGSTVTFPINSNIELIGGKVKAMLDRVVPRDLYDVCQIAAIYPSLLESGNSMLFRRVLLYYASMSAPFPKPFEVARRFAGRDREVEEILYPMLIAGDRPDLQTMIATAVPFIAAVTTPEDDVEQRYFAEAATGHFRPELLFTDYPETLEAAKHDPAALWKMQNIQKIYSEDGAAIQL
jgi:hypothetical protein